MLNFFVKFCHSSKINDFIGQVVIIFLNVTLIHNVV